MSNVIEKALKMQLNSQWKHWAKASEEDVVAVLYHRLKCQIIKNCFVFCLDDLGVLLGDSAYGLRRYLLTPFIAPETGPQEKYNKALTITRCRVEHTFGVLKNRFRSLLIPLRVIGPVRSCNVITAMLVYTILQYRTEIYLSLCLKVLMFKGLTMLLATILMRLASK